MSSRTVLLLSSALLLGSCATMPPASDSKWLPEEARLSPQQHLVVTVRNDVTATTAGVGSTPRGYSMLVPYAVSRAALHDSRAIAEKYNLRPVASWPIALLNVYCLVYRTEDAARRELLLADMQRDSRVESVQRLETFTTQTSQDYIADYNDTYAALQRNLDELAVPQAQRWSRGHGVRVALIDTGVDVDHADLQGRIAGWRNFVDEDTVRFRRDRHGTAVAGVIAAVANNNIGIVGIAPEVRLLAYKACWEGRAGRAAVCNTFTLAQALSAAIEARADIVNLSLAGPSDRLLGRLIQSGQRMGIIFVGAAPASPAGFPIDVEGVIGVEASEFSEPGGPRPGLIAAPGQDIFTLTPAGHYDAASGSSLAAAEVTGMIALLHAREPRIGAEQARRLLVASVRPVKTNKGTRSAINICEAVAAVAPDTRCNLANGSQQVRRH